MSGNLLTIYLSTNVLENKIHVMQDAEVISNKNFMANGTRSDEDYQKQTANVIIKSKILRLSSKIME